MTSLPMFFDGKDDTKSTLVIAVTSVVVAATTIGFLYARNIRTKNNDNNDYAEPPPDATFATVLGHQIRYVDSAERNQQIKSQNPRTLVLVHGFSGCLETWSLVTPLLLLSSSKEPLRVVALDLLGSGFSDKPFLEDNDNNDKNNFDYTLRGQGKALAEFIKVLKLSNVVLVGHSAGAIAVSAAAAALMEDGNTTSVLQGLVMVAPGFFLSKPKLFSYRMFHWLSRCLAGLMAKNRTSILKTTHIRKEALTDEILAAFVASNNTSKSIPALEAMVISEEEPYVDVLSEIPKDLPIHFVWSDLDKVNPMAADKVQAQIREGKLKAAPFTYKLLLGSGHYIQHELPGPLAEEILAFCERLSR